MRLLRLRIRDRFVRKPREGPPRPRSRAPFIEASFLSTPGRGPTPHPRSPFRCPSSELEACRGFAATITSPCVPSTATFAPLVGRSERHRPRHPCTPAPLLTVLALPRCQTQLFDFCNTMNDTRARLRSDARILARAFGFTLCTFTTIRLGEPLQRATRLVPDASHCLEAAPSEEEDPGPRTVSSSGRAGAERTDEARVKVKSAQFPGGSRVPY